MLLRFGVSPFCFFLRFTFFQICLPTLLFLSPFLFHLVLLFLSLFCSRLSCPPSPLLSLSLSLSFISETSAVSASPCGSLPHSNRMARLRPHPNTRAPPLPSRPRSSRAPSRPSTQPLPTPPLPSFLTASFLPHHINFLFVLFLLHLLFLSHLFITSQHLQHRTERCSLQTVHLHTSRRRGNHRSSRVPLPSHTLRAQPQPLRPRRRAPSLPTAPHRAQAPSPHCAASPRSHLVHPSGKYTPAIRTAPPTTAGPRPPASTGSSRTPWHPSPSMMTTLFLPLPLPPCPSPRSGNSNNSNNNNHSNSSSLRPLPSQRTWHDQACIHH